MSSALNTKSKSIVVGFENYYMGFAEACKGGVRIEEPSICQTSTLLIQNLLENPWGYKWNPIPGPISLFTRCAFGVFPVLGGEDDFTMSEEVAARMLGIAPSALRQAIGVKLLESIKKDDVYFLKPNQVKDFWKDK